MKVSLRSAAYCLPILASFLYIYSAHAAEPGQGMSLMPPSPIAKHANASVMFGTVVKTMNAGGYTYVQLQSGNQKVWAAGPVTPVKKGDAVRISTSMPMRGFHSTALKRDFSLVYFTDSIVIAPGKHMQTAITTNAGSNPNPHTSMQMPSASHVNTLAQHIQPAKNGKTIADIFSQREHLKGKQVRVRGEVVKYVGNIFGKNWIHIRDSSSGKTLLVITKDSTQRDVILVKGIVVLDKDNGIGHVYKVVLDNAHILGD